MLTGAKVVLVIISVILIASVLLQSGRSAGLGAITGGSNESTSRRGKGTDPLLARTTTVVAIVFYVITILIAWIVTHS